MRSFQGILAFPGFFSRPGTPDAFRADIRPGGDFIPGEEYAHQRGTDPDFPMKWTGRRCNRPCLVYNHP